METAAPKTRLMSLDALRGFDMFWIIGGDFVARAVAALWPVAPFQFLGRQFSHVPWEGFVFYDLIFPLFIFISGVSVAVSLPRQIERKGRAGAIRGILRRTAILIVLGLIYSGGIAKAWPDVRLLGILQRIGFAYAGAAILFCFLRPRGLIAAGVAILLGYAAVLAWVPVKNVQLEKSALAARLGVPEPTMAQVKQLWVQETGTVTGRYEAGLNVVNHFDFRFLPGKLYYTYWDPEGLLSTVPSVVTCLLGVLAGLLLVQPDRGGWRKVGLLAAGGVALLATGWVWHLRLPVVKNIWTPSYVLVTAGWSILLLALFYAVVDLLAWQKWCVPFVWIGLNPITLYMASSLVSFRTLAARVVGPDVQSWLDHHLAAGAGLVALTGTALALMLGVAWFLQRRQIFLRI